MLAPTDKPAQELSIWAIERKSSLYVFLWTWSIYFKIAKFVMQVIQARPLQFMKRGDCPVVPKYDEGAHLFLRHLLRLPSARMSLYFEHIF